MQTWVIRREEGRTDLSLYSPPCPRLDNNPGEVEGKSRRNLNMTGSTITNVPNQGSILGLNPTKTKLPKAKTKAKCFVTPAIPIGDPEIHNSVFPNICSTRKTPQTRCSRGYTRMDRQTAIGNPNSFALSSIYTNKIFQLYCAPCFSLLYRCAEITLTAFP